MTFVLVVLYQENIETSIPTWASSLQPYVSFTAANVKLDSVWTQVSQEAGKLEIQEETTYNSNLHPPDPHETQQTGTFRDCTTKQNQGQRKTFIAWNS